MKKKLLKKMLLACNIRPEETNAILWGFLYIFTLFIAYYLLRPIRDELGVTAGVDNLSWLFLGTLLAMVVMNPLYSYAAKKWTRVKFIAFTYRFFSFNLLFFIIGLSAAGSAENLLIGRLFFIWVSVFNLFVVSVFWSFIVDVFNSEQGKRLFGLLSAGSTLGGIAGSALTSGFIEKLGQQWLLLLAVVFLEFAVFACKKLSLFSKMFNTDKAENENSAIGGSILSGLTHTLRSPYLIGISCFILFNSVISTFLYFQQADIVSATFSDKTERTVFLANIDLLVNVFTLIFQLFVASRFLKITSVGIVLCMLPLASLAGLGVLALFPTAAMLTIVQVSRRVSNFGLSRPTREILFTNILREDRYKAKNFIDTVIYRTGDQMGSWSYTGLLSSGMGTAHINLIVVPVSIVWLLLSIWLGRKQSEMEDMPAVQIKQV